jgi:hypothetical protein
VRTFLAAVNDVIVCLAWAALVTMAFVSIRIICEFIGGR